MYGERKLEYEVIPSNMGLSVILMCKCRYEIDYLVEKKLLPDISEETKEQTVKRFASCVTRTIQKGNSYKESAEVLSQLSQKYRVNVVSNYYGNLKTVLTEAGFLPYITHIIDSTVVGVRKPDPAIWQMAIEASDCRPEEMLVVGDSIKNDILPAQSLGCATAWLTREVTEGYGGRVIRNLSDLFVIVTTSSDSW
ncbi:Phosphoglycolate phosphatase [termite gut metagenome]|uniref:Phosphoglycolate phosphatase n=1 Tax=termite gut metagenome TaxID=433724 RepID=A0A5J4QNK9_9ZZZZ